MSKIVPEPEPPAVPPRRATEVFRLSLDIELPAGARFTLGRTASDRLEAAIKAMFDQDVRLIGGGMDMNPDLSDRGI